MHHKIHWFENGQASVRPDLANDPLETMHSWIGPWLEAHEVYLKQARLSERLALPGPPLVVFDIGFGIGANALATFEAFHQGKRDLHLVSFENDLDGIYTALQDLSAFEYLERNKATLRSILLEKHLCVTGPAGNSLTWDLSIGDFRDSLLSFPRPDVVFFDLYSPKVCPELWGFKTFELIYQAMSRTPLAPTLPTADPSILITYCAATSVRAALLLAGFSVGRGAATEAKKETTLATPYPGAHSLFQPLDESWYKKFSRSSKPLPDDAPSQSQLRLLGNNPFAKDEL